MSDRRLIRSPTPSQIALIAVVMLAVAIGLWLGRPRPVARQASQTGAEPGTTAESGAGSGPLGSAGAAAGTPLPEEHVPTPPCWEGLFALDDRPTLLGLKDALLAAMAQQDPLLIDYLQERLAEVIGGDSTSALQVIGWAADAGPPLSGHLFGAVKLASAVQNKAVSDKLLSLGSDVRQSTELRRGALLALETQQTLSPDARGQLHSVALDPRSEEVAWMATRTIGKVMTEEYARTGQAGAYVKDLLDIGQRGGDGPVRSLALEMPSYGNIPMDSAQLGSIAQLLAKDPDRSVREMAAFRLGLSKDPGLALSHLGGAFSAEKDLCVRWAIFRFAVRAAGDKALPLLDKLSKLEPRLRPDYEDFVAIYARGTVDFARVWLEKPERIQCLDDE